MTAVSLGPFVFDASRLAAIAAVLLFLTVSKIVTRRKRQTGHARAVEAWADWAVLAWILGARLGFVLAHAKDFATAPLDALKLWQGGFSARAGWIAAGAALAVAFLKGRGAVLRPLLPEMLASLFENLPATHWPTLVIGALAMAFLFWSRRSLKPMLIRLGVPLSAAALLARTGPVLVVAASIAAVILLEPGVAVVGKVPQGLPPLSMPVIDPALWTALLPSAFLIALIGFVESVSVAQTLAAKRRQSISPDQELIGLGMANLAAAFSSGYPVTGGFARSVVNFDAGAQTPAAGAFTAIGIALASLFLTPLLYHLPIAVLAATITHANIRGAKFFH